MVGSKWSTRESALFKLGYKQVYVYSADLCPWGEDEVCEWSCQGDGHDGLHCGEAGLVALPGALACRGQGEVIVGREEGGAEQRNELRDQLPFGVVLNGAVCVCV